MAKFTELGINYFLPINSNDVKEISVIISMWTLSLNYKNYISAFPETLFELSLNGDSKEDFLKEEIEDIRERIQELRSILSRYSVNPKVRYISELNSVLEKDDSDPLDLLKDIQNKTIDPKDRLLLVIERISNRPLSHILPYCCSAYLDLVRIYQSLESQLNEFGGDTQEPKEILNGKSLPDNPYTEAKTHYSYKDSVVVEGKTCSGLKDLFNSGLEYDTVIDNLIQNEILVRDKEFFRLNAVELEENKLRLKRAICALGYLLKTKNYFKQGTSDVTIAKALSGFFKESISKATYNKAKEQCFNFGGDKAEDYFKLYFSI